MMIQPAARSHESAWTRRTSRRAAALLVVTAYALIARLWRLGQAPDTLNTDELVALRLVASILRGHGPGPLALDENGQPALGGYIQALSMRAFGDSAWALRLPAALLGALAVPLFYLVARRLTRPWPALGASALFAASVYNLSLARSGWINDYALPAELIAIWAILEASRRRQTALLCASALACAAAGYGYAPFRLLPVGFVALLLSNGLSPCRLPLSSSVSPFRRTFKDIVRVGRWRPALTWIGAYLLGSLPLWASLVLQHTAVAHYIAQHRINSGLPEYPSSMPMALILALQVWKVVVGLVLLVPGTASGLDLQHVPPGSWLLDGPCTLLYWLGLWSLAGRGAGAGGALPRSGDNPAPGMYVHETCSGIGAASPRSGDDGRRTPSLGALWWWVLMIPLLLAEAPVRDSPALHPAVAAFPLYLLVAARGLAYLSGWLGHYRGMLVLLVLWSALTGVGSYAAWVNSPAATQARHKEGVGACYPDRHLLARSQPCRDQRAPKR